MTTWNVLTGVVQLVEAETAEEAERIAGLRVSNAVVHFGNVYDLTDLTSEANPKYRLAIESEPLQ